MTKITKISTTLSVLKREKSYLHKNGVEFHQGANGTIVRTLSEPQDHIPTSKRLNLNFTLKYHVGALCAPAPTSSKYGDYVGTMIGQC